MGLTDLIYRYLLQDEQTRDSDTKLYMRICAHLMLWRYICPSVM